MKLGTAKLRQSRFARVEKLFAFENIHIHIIGKSGNGHSRTNNRRLDVDVGIMFCTAGHASQQAFPEADAVQILLESGTFLPGTSMHPLVLALCRLKTTMAGPHTLATMDPCICAARDKASRLQLAALFVVFCKPEENFFESGRLQDKILHAKFRRGCSKLPNESWESRHAREWNLI